MVTNLEARKLALITFITTLHQEEAMLAFEQLLNEFAPKTRKPKSKGRVKTASRVSKTDVVYFKRPMRADVNVDDLAKEQNWQPIDEKRMDALVQQMAITEP